MISLTIPQPQTTEPSQLFYPCGCTIEGYEQYEVKRTICKIHKNAPISPDPLEGNTPWS